MKILEIITTIALILAIITVSTATAAALSCSDGGMLNASTTPIQAAVDNAGETICAPEESHSENPDIETPHLTLRGEGAADMEAAQTELPDGVSTDWWTAVQEDIRESEYDVTWQETQLPDINAAYQAPNRAHNLRTYFAPDNIRITPRTSADWVFGLSLVGYGFADDVRPVPGAEMSVSENRVEYQRGCLTEWYMNSEDGLEQGFTIDAPPESGSQPGPDSWIAIKMDILGDLDANMNSASDAVELTTTGGVGVLRYGKLHAFDAAGRELDARFALSESGIEILVNTSGAAYPITIDPLAQSPAWTAEGNQDHATFGISVASAGDVNGDGYSDVIVGAPGYDNGEDGEGRAYVYHGSATGLSTSFAWTAESNQSYAFFGYSVASAGDVNGDGYSDVIVGAPGYDNGEDGEGRAYVYHGSATGLSTSYEWTAESNQDGAWFGRSVASAGDVNGDGYSDVIIGAHLYDNGETDEGRAYVYHGSATSAVVTPCDGDICVNQSGWWRDGGGLNASTTPIQAAVDNANAGETICVAAGSYNENVDIATPHLTLRGEGAGVVTVQAADADDHVFEVTADYVNISGFTATGATGPTILYYASGIYLSSVSHCNIYENDASLNKYGIYLRYSSNNTLTDNTASLNSKYGIILSSSSSNTLTGNTADSNNWDGIILSYSSNNTLTGNTADNNWDGIYLDSSSSNTLTGNTADNNWDGIFLSSSSNNTLLNNTMSGNVYNFGVYGSDLSEYTQNIDTSNTVDGKPIYYWVDQKYIQIPSDAGFVGVVNGTNITVRDLTLTNNNPGVLFAYTENSRIENVTANSNNWCGIRLDASSNNTLTSNTANSNNWDGIILSSSSDNTLTGNNASSNNNCGINLYESSNNTLTSNTANSNSGAESGYGVYLSSSSNNTLTSNTANSNNWDGIYLDSSSDNTLDDNIATSNDDYGIHLGASRNNTLVNNNASNNNDGILLYASSGNTLASNTASNNYVGIHLHSSCDNDVICNLVQNNTDCGIYLTSGSTGNNITWNNLVANGELQTDGSYPYQFNNSQSDGVDAINNFWGAGMNNSTIDASIYDDEEGRAEVKFYPFETRPVPCAPAPISEESPAFTTVDAVIALEMAVGSRPLDLHWDVSGDGQVTSLDALMILGGTGTG